MFVNESVFMIYAVLLTSTCDMIATSVLVDGGSTRWTNPCHSLCLVLFSVCAVPDLFLFSFFETVLILLASLSLMPGHAALEARCKVALTASYFTTPATVNLAAITAFVEAVAKIGIDFLNSLIVSVYCIFVHELCEVNPAQSRSQRRHPIFRKRFVSIAFSRYFLIQDLQDSRACLQTYGMSLAAGNPEARSTSSQQIPHTFVGLALVRSSDFTCLAFAMVPLGRAEGMLDAAVTTVLRTVSLVFLRLG